ncbi:MAG: SET domain-containing protein-lysine N-methyltransferase [Chitinophagaceae bacterium]|nr:SET domain-containing protein-lysine N-methyltransferase [Chitinophagaceae bacterium]
MILPSIFTALTENKGWGVFTKSFIAAGTLIEESPVIVMTEAEKALLDQTRLHDYIFFWQDNFCCMAMGNIPIYNHAFPSNCEYFQDYEKNTIYIKSVVDIQANEELCINYNGDYDNAEKVWFKTAE